MLKGERILCSAILYNGLIITGYRHSNCYDVLRALKSDIKGSELPDRDCQGFLTSEGRYVDRKKAWKIADHAGQIKFGPRGMVDAELISENLYDNECETKMKKPPRMAGLTADQIVNHLPIDSVLVKTYNYLGTQRIDVGLTDFSQMGSPVRMTLNVAGSIFNRIKTTVIPDRYVGYICTCQTYELKE